jgi:HSP20 family protein
MFGLTPFNRNAVRRTDGNDRFASLFDDFFSDDFFPIRSLQRDTFKLDVKEEGNDYIIEADMPGIKKEEIQLNYQDGYLSIAVEREEKKDDEQKNYVHRERRFTSMSRSINLGDLDMDQIEANLKDGILIIKAPKSALIENKKKIEIK